MARNMGWRAKCLNLHQWRCHYLPPKESNIS
jgi:hypothetical protein